MSVLIHRRRNEAEAQLTALAERRKEIAGNLQRLHDAVKPITGKEVTPYVIGKLLTGHQAEDAEREAVRTWLNYSGYKDLPVRDEALTTAFYYPKELTALIEAANDCYPATDEPKRYWAKDKFTAPPITQEERAAIMERAEIRAATEADAELYRSAERLVNLANARNQSAGANIVSLADLTTGANIMFSGLVKVKPAGPHPLDEPTFIVDDSGLNMVRTNYRAFDE